MKAKRDVGTVVVCRAPARIDLAGGWSDTPPICIERPGSVLNVGVLVDGRRPLMCACRIIHAQPAQLVLISGEEKILCTSYADLRDVGQPSARGALLKACFIAIGAISPPTSGGTAGGGGASTGADGSDGNGGEFISLQQELMQRYGGGVEVECDSFLPAGSGE